VARPRSAGYEDHRARILAAAARLFAMHGYAATTMNDVAAECGLSKATLYHYVSDKHELLAMLALAHVQRLQALVDEVLALGLPSAERLRELIVRFMRTYADAQHEHRVLTEDVKFLAPGPQREVIEVQRRVVAAFVDAIGAVRPQRRGPELAAPLAMLLFGMMNWTFTWLRSAGPLTHDDVATLVCELFFGGLQAVQGPQPAAAVRPLRRSR
jgi:TetR/AcrR family transcriptional regulator